MTARLLTQGSSATGAQPLSDSERALWTATFILREALIVAPNDMDSNESKMYFNKLFSYTKNVIESSHPTARFPYPLVRMSHVRQNTRSNTVGEVGSVPGKIEYLQVFHFKPELLEERGRKLFTEDIQWHASDIPEPFWLAKIEKMNETRKAKGRPLVGLCLDSNVERFGLFVSGYKSRYDKYTVVESIGAKRGRTSTDSDMSVQKPSDQNRPSSSVLPATREVSPKPTRRTRKPPTKRLKTDLKADEDEDSDHKAISIAKDVKGKGRAANPVDPMPVDMDSEGSDSEAKPWDEYGDYIPGAFVKQNVTFPAALARQLSPIVCEGCAEAGKQCVVELGKFHGCWRCKGMQRGCSLCPQAGGGNLKIANWAWLITLVFHIRAVIDLDTEHGPRDVPPDYEDVIFPRFPKDARPEAAMPNTDIKTQWSKTVKKQEFVDKYNVPAGKTIAIMSARANAPKWPILPTNLEKKFVSILSKAKSDSLNREYALAYRGRNPLAERARSKTRGVRGSGRGGLSRRQTRSVSRKVVKGLIGSSPTPGETSIPRRMPYVEVPSTRTGSRRMTSVPSDTDENEARQPHPTEEVYLQDPTPEPGPHRTLRSNPRTQPEPSDNIPVNKADLRQIVREVVKEEHAALKEYVDHMVDEKLNTASLRIAEEYKEALEAEDQAFFQRRWTTQQRRENELNTQVLPQLEQRFRQWFLDIIGGLNAETKSLFDERMVTFEKRMTDMLERSTARGSEPSMIGPLSAQTDRAAIEDPAAAGGESATNEAEFRVDTSDSVLPVTQDVESVDKEGTQMSDTMEIDELVDEGMECINEDSKSDSEADHKQDSESDSKQESESDRKSDTQSDPMEEDELLFDVPNPCTDSNPSIQGDPLCGAASPLTTVQPPDETGVLPTNPPTDTLINVAEVSDVGHVPVDSENSTSNDGTQLLAEEGQGGEQAVEPDSDKQGCVGPFGGLVGLVTYQSDNSE